MCLVPLSRAKFSNSKKTYLTALDHTGVSLKYIRQDTSPAVLTTIKTFE